MKSTLLLIFASPVMVSAASLEADLDGDAKKEKITVSVKSPEGDSTEATLTIDIGGQKTALAYDAYFDSEPTAAVIKLDNRDHTSLLHVSLSGASDATTNYFLNGKMES